MFGIFKKHDDLVEKVGQLEKLLAQKKRREILLRTALETIGNLSTDKFIKEIAKEAIRGYK